MKQQLVRQQYGKYDGNEIVPSTHVKSHMQIKNMATTQNGHLTKY